MSAGWVRAGRFAFRYRGMLLPIAIVLLLIPSPALMPDPALAGVIGLAIALLGQLIRSANVGLEYIIRGGKNHQVYAEKLVTEGLYSHVRNPMYVANFFLVLGMAIASNSWVFLLLGIPIVVLMHSAIIAAEEDFLRNKFGAEFDAFCARSPRWLPRLSGLAATLRDMRFNWRRMLVQEYQKAFDWVAALALVVIVKIALADALGAHPVVVGLMVVVIGVRIALYASARMMNAADKAATAGR
ncbi:MAG: isoprenylcysteine carboxylmethyltransferase family protein [bacterium]|jgi:protein-S-isoprenylcysteine O-methyltransferase Ste14